MIGLESSSKKIDRFMERVCQRYAPSAPLRELTRLSDKNAASFADLQPHFAECGTLERQVINLLQASSPQVVTQLERLDELHPHFEPAAVHRLAISLRVPWELHGELTSNVTEIAWQAALIRAATAIELERTAKCEALAISLLPAAGIFLLANELGESYTRFLQQIHASRGDWHALERMTLEFDHRAATLRLLANWGLPTSLTQPLELSRSPEIFSQPKLDWQPLVRSLQIADIVTDLLMLQRVESFELLVQTITATGEWKLADIEAIVGRLAPQVERFAQALLLKIPPLSALEERFRVAKSEWQAVRHARHIDDMYEQLLTQTAELSELATSSRRAGGPAAKKSDNMRSAHAGHAPRGPLNVAADELLEHITVQVVDCRQTRSSLSLMLVEVDNFASLEKTVGSEAMGRLVSRLHDSIDEAVGRSDCSLQIAPARWAVVMPNQDKSSALETIKHLLNEVRDWSKKSGQGNRRVVTISVGLASLAVPPKNFPPKDLVDAAQRCLNAAHVAGGDGVKSIDL